MKNMFTNKIDVITYIKELEEKIQTKNITKENIADHLITIKYLKYLRNQMLHSIIESIFFFFIIYLLLHNFINGWYILILFCACFLIIFSFISEFFFYNKNIQYFYKLNDQMNNIVNNNNISINYNKKD